MSPALRSIDPMRHRAWDVEAIRKHFLCPQTIEIDTRSGNVSDNVIGQTLYMAGTMTALISAFGDPVLPDHRGSMS
jgi:hypothetical protein